MISVTESYHSSHIGQICNLIISLLRQTAKLFLTIKTLALRRNSRLSGRIVGESGWKP